MRQENVAHSFEQVQSLVRQEGLLSSLGEQSQCREGRWRRRESGAVGLGKRELTPRLSGQISGWVYI